MIASGSFTIGFWWDHHKARVLQSILVSNWNSKVRSLGWSSGYSHWLSFVEVVEGCNLLLVVLVFWSVDDVCLSSKLDRNLGFKWNERALSRVDWCHREVDSWRLAHSKSSWFLLTILHLCRFYNGTMIATIDSLGNLFAAKLFGHEIWRIGWGAVHCFWIWTFNSFCFWSKQFTFYNRRRVLSEEFNVKFSVTVFFVVIGSHGQVLLELIGSWDKISEVVLLAVGWSSELQTLKS